MNINISFDHYTPIHYMISNKNLSCKSVSNHLKKVGISGTVTSHQTICCDNSQTKCQIEKGCLITMYNIPLQTFYEKIVIPLHQEQSLHCGYVQIDGIFSGCVNNLFRQSHCKK